jgi:hypothetical protein
MSKPKTEKVVTLTTEEAALCVRLIRAGGWHRRKELSETMQESPVIMQVSRLLKKLEQGQ